MNPWQSEHGVLTNNDYRMLTNVKNESNLRWVVEMAWLGLVGPILALVGQLLLENPCMSFISGSEGGWAPYGGCL